MELLTEGLNNLSSLSFKKAIVCFIGTIDLKSICCTVAFKSLLNKNGIKVLEVKEIVSEGEFELTRKHHHDTLLCLLNFEHSKPIYTLSIDPLHNTYKGVVDWVNHFTDEDIRILAICDSKDLQDENQVNELVSFILDINPDLKTKTLKIAQTLQSNMLIKKHIDHPGLIKYVMESVPSLSSIYLHVIDYCHRHKIKLHKTRKEPKYKDVQVKNKIIVKNTDSQPFKINVFDYKLFNLHPECNFLIQSWNIGVIQILKNPDLPSPIDLSVVTSEIMGEFEDRLRKIIVPLSCIKWSSQGTKVAANMDFNFKDLQNNKNVLYGHRSDKDSLTIDIFNKTYTDLTEEEWTLLDRVGIGLWDLFRMCSDSADGYSTIAGIHFYGIEYRPSKALIAHHDRKSLKLIRMIKNRFIAKLNGLPLEPHLIP